MPANRNTSAKQKQATSILTEALRTNSLRRTDQQAAFTLLCITMPDLARLPPAVSRLFTKTALRNACAVIPAPPTHSPVPPPPPLARRLENSNDLIPCARPKHPPTTPPVQPRKRRRASRMSGDMRAEMEDSSSAMSFVVSRPPERLCDVGGIEQVLCTIRELVEWPLQHANMYAHLGVSPPRGILLHGPPGCGKSLLATAIAGELGVTFLKVSGPEIVSGVSGESERKLRNVFEEAVRLQPSILFVDEVDAIASRREGASKDMERRIVSQLLSCVDQLGVRRQVREKMDGEVKGVEKGEIESSAKSGDESSLHVDVDVNDGTGDCVMGAPSVVVIAATNRPECLEPALRRAGRFDREIELGAPDETARAAIISKLSRNLRLGADFEVGSLAKRSAGYVGADLGLLIKEAGLACIRRFAKTRAESRCASRMDESEMADVEDVGRMKRKITGKELENLAIEMCDFQQALDTIQPSALREGFATRPDVSWDNVGSLECVREEMMMAIVQPIRHPHMFSSVGLHAPAGVLLYGPPGCGKTLLARAVASESGANFISVKGPELLSKYVGDSELAVRKVFARARSSCPCVIFFDELDALAPRRGSGGADSGASERVVNMLLTEMDGFTDRKQVFLIAATNRPDIIDPAMLRPGRLDKLIFVPLPDEKGRASILRTLLRGVQVCDEVDVDEISRKKECQGFSGADLQAVIRVAGECALRERMKMGDVGDVMTRIEQRHFDAAVQNVVPSVSPRDARLYCDMQGWLRNSRGNLERRND